MKNYIIIIFGWVEAGSYINYYQHMNILHIYPEKYMNNYLS